MKKLLMIMAMVAVIAMAGTASAAPDLSAPGSFYVDLDNGVNNDGPANGWAYSTATAFIYENDDYMRYSDGDTEFKMTVSGLTGGGLYDVAVLYGDQWDLITTHSWKPIEAGLVSGVLTELMMSNGTSTTQTGPVSLTWYQLQSDPGVVGVGTASGAGDLEIFFAGVAGHLRDGEWVGGEGFIDGVVLTPQAAPVPEPAGLGLIGLALLAVRKRRNA